MKRKAVNKILIVIAVILLVAVICLGVYLYFLKDKIAGRVVANDKYVLTEITSTISSTVFFGVALNNDDLQNCWFEIDEDKKTGRFYFHGAEEIVFIITKYSQKFTQTTFSIEYIHNGKFYLLNAISTAAGIEFKSPKDYEVSITQENPEDIPTINYDSRILFFVKEAV
ncbi:MAG: hypothetical protein LBQ05_01210 [Christensenellaceae bacterium]|jgi:hypothetical protein|nr:hypothetical protein [Christensenellaceae bacterium]